MPTYVSDTGGGVFTPHPTGLFQMVCCDVIDNGIVDTQWGKKQKVTLRWQSEEVGEKGHRLTVQKRYTRSLNEKASLRKDLESWRGRAFTEDELHQFDLDVLLGVNAMVNVVHKIDQGKTWANVASLAPLMKNLPKIAAAADYVLQRDRATEPEPDEVPHDDERPAAITADDVPF